MSFKPFLRPNKVLAAIERGEMPLGMQMYTHDPDLIEVVGYTGFDYVMIDMEHNRTNPETMVHLIRAAEVSGLTPLVRVGARPLPYPLGGGVRRPGHRRAAREDRRRGQGRHGGLPLSA